MKKDLTLLEMLMFMGVMTVAMIAILTLSEYYFANFRDDPSRQIAQQMYDIQVNK